MIYLDHAATTPLREGVLEAMLPFLMSEYANASGAYRASRNSRRAVDRARGQVASLIGAQPHEIYFTSGGTESDNWALIGGYHAAKRSNPQRSCVITSRIEHHAILHTCSFLESAGAICRRLPVSRNGMVVMDEMNTSIDERTALVSIMLANNETGAIQPVREIAESAHSRGALMHTDAVQAVGHIPVSVEELQVDMLSMSAHKFGGPKGIGALYIRKGTRIDPLMYGGAQEKGMRPGTENTAAIVGMGAAAQLACEAGKRESERVCALRDAMREMIRERLPDVRINGDPISCLPGHVHISVPGWDTSLLLTRLDMEGIAASAASACASGSIERSHVLAAMYPQEQGCADLRFTIGADNTMEEIVRTVALLGNMIENKGE